MVDQSQADRGRRSTMTRLSKLGRTNRQPIRKGSAVAVRCLALAFGLLAMALAGGIVTASRAGASPPQPFTAHIEDNIFSGEGTWSASGAVSDSGAFSFVPFAPFGGNGSSVYTGHAIVTLTGQQGTLTFRIEALFSATNDPNVVDSTGQFVFVGGTGLYSALKGEGQESGSTNIATGMEVNDLEGDVHSD